MSYQFKEPSEPTGEYQATVVIRTRTENALPLKRDHDGVAGQVSEGVPKTEVLGPIGVQDQATPLLSSNRPELLEGETASASPYSIQEKQSFKLVYRDDRWQLAQELETDPERLWFQYALQQ
jgi:hypothetical protein